MFFKKKIENVENIQEPSQEEKERQEIMKSLNIMAHELWNIHEKVIEPHSHYSTLVYLDDERTNYIWASVFKDTISLTMNNINDFIRIEPDGNDSIQLNRSFEETKTLRTISAFIKNYDEIRDDIFNKVIRDIEEYDSERSKAIDTATLFNQRYSKEATVEIDLPMSMDRRRMEVTKEDGRNIGIIDCGDMTIKFVTSGDIQFVDLRKEEESKIKKK